MNKIVLGVLLLLLMSSCDLLHNSRLKEIISSITDDVRSEENSGEQPVSYEEKDVLLVVEEMPEFPGGTNALMEYVSKTIQYPEAAKKEGIQGRVMVTFIVDKEGEIKDAKVMRGIDDTLDKEALRVVNNMPRWNPGRHKGENVSVRFTLPLNFQIPQ